MTDRKIDKLIAENIFNEKVIETGFIDDPEWTELFYAFDDGSPRFDILGDRIVIPHYTKNMSYALKVVDKLNNLSFNINRENCMGIRYDLYTYNNYDMKDKISLNCQENLPLAICKLALIYNGVLK